MVRSFRTRPVWGAVVASVALATAAGSASATSYSGSISTPASEGVVGGGNYAPAGGGFAVSWFVAPNTGGTWDYRYTFTTDAGGSLRPALSHAIFELSRNIEASEVYNFGGQFESSEIRTFGPQPSNPGIPGFIFGVKVNTSNPGSGVTTVSFTSTRQPQWGDFYAKGGNDSFAFNTDFGVAAANANDYTSPAVDAFGRPLFKILVPDTIPTPGTGLLAGLGVLAAARRRR